MTGGGYGLCARPESINARARYGGLGYGSGMRFGPGPGWGIGLGRCRGAGRGWRHWGFGGGYFGDERESKEDEIAMLRAEAVTIKKSLDMIQRRIEELSRPESAE